MFRVDLHGCFVFWFIYTVFIHEIQNFRQSYYKNFGYATTKRTTNNIEIDLVDCSDGNFISAYEIKSSMTFQKKYVQSVSRGYELLNSEFIKPAVIYRGQHSFKYDNCGIYSVKDWLSKINLYD